MSKSNSGDLFGHPKGLYVLFFTELWERFSFYGMKTLLVLYMINHFFWSQEEASDLLGTYAALAYGLPVVGGFIADRWLGAKRAVVLGAILLSLGHICMAFEPLPFFYTALGLIIAGVGFLKPNISTQVGSLYKPGDQRRDGAFTIFYMGINVGALAGPLLCDWLRLHYGYHYGFGAAGVGMILGLIVYIIGQRKLVEFKQDAPDEQEKPAEEVPKKVERDRIVVLLVIFAFVILFWTAFEQSPNAMLVWADKHTNLSLTSTEPVAVSVEPLPAAGEAAEPAEQEREPTVSGITMTSGQTQSFNPFFIITLAPLFAFLWVWLNRRKRQPSTPTKMVLGLALVALAFGVMWPAAYRESRTAAAALEKPPDGVDFRQYGATRLYYDADSKQLVMNGVLPDLDRLRVLAESAPADLEGAVGRLVERSTTRAVEAKLGEEWSFSERLLAAPDHYALVGEHAAEVVTWDGASKTMAVRGEIKERARVEILAGGAQPALRAAVDEIYVQSSTFRVSVWWLVLFYLFLTMGELCISPVGLSLVTKLAPAKHVGLFMGGWFLATAVAEKVAQIFGAYWGKMPPTTYFFMFVAICGAGALFMALLVRTLKRRMHGVQ